MRGIKKLFVACIVLLLISVGSSFGVTRNLISDGKFSSIPVDVTGAAEGDYAVGEWRYINLSGAGGSLSVTDGGRDGTGSYIELGRTSTSGSLSLDMNNSHIQALEGHTYRYSFWMRTDAADIQTVEGIVAAFDVSNTYIGNTSIGIVTPTSEWTQYSVEFDAPAGTTNLNPQIQLDTIGSVQIADVCLVDTASDLNLISDGEFDSVSAASTRGDYMVGTDWRLVNYSNTAGNACGNLGLVTPGRDGTGQAIKLAKTEDGQFWLDIFNIYKTTGRFTPVEVGHTYRYTFWIRSDDAGQACQAVIASYNANNGAIENSVVAAFSASSEWTQCSALYTVPSGCAYASCQIVMTSIGSIELDDLRLEDVTTIADNLVYNSEFDSFTDNTTCTTAGANTVCGWRFVHLGSAGGSLTTIAPGYDGSGKAVKLARTSTEGNLWIDIDQTHLPAQAAHKYRYTFWARTDETTEQTVHGLVATYDASGAWLGNLGSLFAVSSKWTQYAAEFTTPANTTCVNPMLLIYNVGSIEVDCVSLTDVTTGSMSGTVTSALSGNPIAGASVSMQSILGSENMLMDAGFETSIVGTTVSAEGFNFFSDWALYTYGANGSAEVISPGHNGSHTAVKVTRGLSGGDSGLRQQTGSFQGIVAGHTYRVSAWLRSDDASPLAVRFSVDCYNSSDATSPFTTKNVEFTPNSTWTQYSADFTAPNSVVKSDYTIRYQGVGSFEADDLSVKDVTSTFDATTDSSGAYSFTIGPSIFAVNASARRYSSSVETDALASVGTAVTKDIVLMPNSSMSWNVSDTFDRTDNTDLGITDDGNALPWVKSTTNTNSSIYGNSLYLYNNGTAHNGACLGRSFTPTDFDLTATLNWIDEANSLWAGITYRQASIGTAEEGYVVQLWRWDGAMNLYCNGTKLTTVDVSSIATGIDTIKLSIHGDSHKIWLNDTLVIDITDSTVTDGGYVGFFCDRYNIVKWDNFSMSYQGIVDPEITGSVTDVKSADDNTDVEVTSAVVTGVYDGFFYIEDTNRVSGIKVVSGDTVSIGDVVDVIGTMGTANAERYISAATVTVCSTDTIAPLGMTGKSINGSGLSGVGLLVRTWGEVTYVNSTDGYCYIDDGSGISDGPAYTGVKVITSGLSNQSSIAVDSYYELTGVLGMSESGCVIYPQTSTSLE